MTIYALDPTGIAPANQVVSETFDLATSKLSLYGYLELSAGLFYKNGMSATYTTPEGVAYPLTYGVHFWPYFHLVGATAEGAENTVWAGLGFYNPSLPGTLTISYQAFGGSFVLDKQAVNLYVSSNNYSQVVAFLELVPARPFPAIDEEAPFSLTSFSEIARAVETLGTIALSVAIRLRASPLNPTPVVGNGEKGDPGASAYDIAVANGYVGTPQAWLLSLKGADGAGATLGGSQVVVASANLALTDASKVYQFIDPNGANRDVTLPAPEPQTPGAFLIKNTGTLGEILTVKNAAGDGVGVPLANGFSLFVVWSGLNWEAL